MFSPPWAKKKRDGEGSRDPESPSVEGSPGGLFAGSDTGSEEDDEVSPGNPLEAITTGMSCALADGMDSNFLDSDSKLYVACLSDRIGPRQGEFIHPDDLEPEEEDLPTGETEIAYPGTRRGGAYHPYPPRLGGCPFERPEGRASLLLT